MASVLILDDNVTDFTGVSENLIIYGGHKVESRQMSDEVLNGMDEGNLPDAIIMRAEMGEKNEDESSPEIKALTLTSDIKKTGKYPNLEGVAVIVVSDSPDLRRLAVEMCGADRGCELNGDPQELSKVIDSALENKAILKM